LKKKIEIANTKIFFKRSKNKNKKIKKKGIKFEIKTKQEGKYHSNQGRNQKQI
jgi:hypothetical protein